MCNVGDWVNLTVESDVRRRHDCLGGIVCYDTRRVSACPESIMIRFSGERKLLGTS